jgi:hypothetical protein
VLFISHTLQAKGQRGEKMITEAGWIIIVNIICATIITVVTLLTRRDLNSLRPEVMDVREQLKEANKFIIDQGHRITALRDEIAMRKPTMTEKRFDADFKASPPYKKPDK